VNRQIEKFPGLGWGLGFMIHYLLLGWPLPYGNNWLTVALLFMKIRFENWYSERIAEMMSGLWHL